MNLNKLVMYYHYTSLGTFLAILHGIDYNSGESVLKEIGPILHLHASRIDTVNDPTEMTIDKSAFLSIVRHYEENKNPKFRISNRIESMDDEKFLELIKNERSDYLPYIVCFSQNEDFLPMWSLYGDKGRGICLGFSKDIQYYVKGGYNKDLSLPMEGDVYYRNYPHAKSASTYLDLFYNIIIKKADEPIEDTIAMTFLCASPFLKHKSYEYENEYRISIYKKNELKNLYDNKDECIYYDIPVSFLKTITLGTKLPFGTTSELFYDYFSKKGLHIEIKKSQIPFR